MKKRFHKPGILPQIIIAVLLLLICCIVSITYGAKTVGYSDIWGALFDAAADSFNVNVVRARIPRTLFGIIAGASLATAGCMMQSITRNPIADPSILGVNTGASLFVVFGIAFFNITSKQSYILLAFAGAMLTAFLVYGLASIGNGGATPMKLALAGTASSTALQSLVNTIMLPDTQVMDKFRFWQVGSIGGSNYEDIINLMPYFMLGMILSVAVASQLNALALGEEAATGLGVNVGLVRLISAFAGVLLCASTTALAGPIGFVGLMVPHIVRIFTGPDVRKIIPVGALFGGCLMVVADTLGRVLGSPGEIESGIITALLGAPIFIFVIRKGKVNAL